MAFQYPSSKTSVVFYLSVVFKKLNHQRWNWPVPGYSARKRYCHPNYGDLGYFEITSLAPEKETVGFVGIRKRTVTLADDPCTGTGGRRKDGIIDRGGPAQREAGRELAGPDGSGSQLGCRDGPTCHTHGIARRGEALVRSEEL